MSVEGWAFFRSMGEVVFLDSCFVLSCFISLWVLRQRKNNGSGEFFPWPRWYHVTGMIWELGGNNPQLASFHSEPGANYICIYIYIYMGHIWCQLHGFGAYGYFDGCFVQVPSTRLQTPDSAEKLHEPSFYRSCQVSARWPMKLADKFPHQSHSSVWSWSCNIWYTKYPTTCIYVYT